MAQWVTVQARAVIAGDKDLLQKYHFKEAANGRLFVFG